MRQEVPTSSFMALCQCRGRPKAGRRRPNRPRGGHPASQWADPGDCRAVSTLMDIWDITKRWQCQTRCSEPKAIRVVSYINKHRAADKTDSRASNERCANTCRSRTTGRAMMRRVLRPPVTSGNWILGAIFRSPLPEPVAVHAASRAIGSIDPPIPPPSRNSQRSSNPGTWPLPSFGRARHRSVIVLLPRWCRSAAMLKLCAIAVATA